MIRRAAEVVCGALALGGGAMLQIAPPANSLAGSNTVAVNHGILAIIAVLMYVIIVARIAYSSVQIRPDRWHRPAIFLGLGGAILLVAYVVCRPNFVVSVEGSEYLIGMWRDEDWLKTSQLADKDSQEVVDDISIENAYSDVWSERSRLVSYLALMAWYLVSTLMVLGAMFCASESRVWAGIRKLAAQRRPNGDGSSNQ